MRVDDSLVGYSCPPSRARTSMSTHATEETISSANAAFYASWEESSDIRGDWIIGWGNDGNLGLGRQAAAASTESKKNDKWGWRLQNSAVHSVPAFYPMDSRSTRRIDLSVKKESQYDLKGVKNPSNSTNLLIEDVSYRISAACQRLSIHGVWDNLCPTAALCSMEFVEMEVRIYFASSHLLTSHQQASSHALLVEVQRRMGCPITFHNYRRCLLDAAEGKFDPESFDKTDGLDKPFGRDRCNQPRATVLADSIIARPTLSKKSITRPSFDRPGGPSLNPLRVPSFSADDTATPIAGLKSDGKSSDEIKPSLSEEIKPSSTATFDKAMEALNMAASLIKKDRIDARQVGIESLVLLTDPLRAGMETAKIASHVVLLGSAHKKIAYGDDEADALFDASSGLGIREAILEMIMANDVDDTQDMMTDDADGFKEIEKEFTDHIINLCLAVLNNALHTVAEGVRFSPPSLESDFYSDDRDYQRVATEYSALTSSDHGATKRFIDDTNATFGLDVLSLLLKSLGQARTNPHDAYHSASCLGVLFKGCGNSHKARARRDLDAKRIISAALEVGSRTHAKLADASRQAMEALVTDDEERKEDDNDQVERME
ncbi:hypothetical protein ACHAXA_007431 [Cyclostephanos tholiformis]|uniref:Uncharacterized protein n=1 Tax=Cyclostephanos tholiformis TaxID=382380 RepID=A0ABD3SD13_9STRA